MTDTEELALKIDNQIKNSEKAKSFKKLFKISKTI